MEKLSLDAPFIEWNQITICWEVFNIWDQAEIYIAWFDEAFQGEVTWIRSHIIELDWQVVELNNAYRAVVKNLSNNVGEIAQVSSSKAAETIQSVIDILDDK